MRKKYGNLYEISKFSSFALKKIQGQMRNDARAYEKLPNWHQTSKILKEPQNLCAYTNTFVSQVKVDLSKLSS